MRPLIFLLLLLIPFVGISQTTKRSDGVEITDDAKLFGFYLRDKTFRSSGGTELQIKYNSADGNFCIYVNGKRKYNITPFTDFLTRTTAIIKGESTDDDSTVKIYVD